jgi:hypothetical protein
VSTKVTDDALDDLERKAKAATPGPWTREKPPSNEDGWATGVVVAGTPGRQTVYANPPGGSFPSADCDFISAANPAVVLALVAELRRLRELEQAVESTTAEFGGWRHAEADLIVHQEEAVAHDHNRMLDALQGLRRAGGRR